MKPATLRRNFSAGISKLYTLFRFIIVTIIFLISVVFPLISQEKPLFAFGLMTDVQYADRDNSGSRYYRMSPGKLEEAVRVFNRERVAFVLHLGDFINDNLHSFDTLLRITGKLETPLFFIPGNHEFGVQTGDKEKVLPLMGLSRRGYQSFSRDGWRFILVDGSETGIFRYEKGSREYEKNRRLMEKLKTGGATNVFEWNGGISHKQYKWIEKNLREAGNKGERVILFCHFPLMPGKAPELLLNAPSVKTLIEKFPGVFAWLNGHVHVTQYVDENGINYVSFRGMVEKDANAFCIVSVYNDRLEIKGYGEEVCRKLVDSNF
jgi:manganese-dependent ADP-ribose/CDP-alcohol diphosphatase